jgi:hypothetical protein
VILFLILLKLMYVRLLERVRSEYFWLMISSRTLTHNDFVRYASDMLTLLAT